VGGIKRLPLTLMTLNGFRKNSKMYDTVLAQRVKGVVSREAMVFVLYSFFGGLFGGVIGGFFAFGLGAFLF